MVITTIINNKVKYVVCEDFSLVYDEMVEDSISYGELLRLELEDIAVFD